MKITIPITLIAIIAATLPAAVKGPYSVDSYTLQLWHLNEMAVPAVNAVDSIHNLNGLHNGATLGNASFIGFGTALNTNTQLTESTNQFGLMTYTAALSAATTADTPTSFQYVGADGAFTIEAIVKLSAARKCHGLGQAMVIVAMDGDGTNTQDRNWTFRILCNASTGVPERLEFQPIRSNTGGTVRADLPTTGDHKPNTNDWFHVAVTYNGQANQADNMKLYWTNMNSGAVEANLIGSGITATLGEFNPATMQGDFSIGNEARSTNGHTENFGGFIDEVRISSIARQSDEMLFGPARTDLSIVSGPSNASVSEGGTSTFQTVFQSQTLPTVNWYKVASPNDTLLSPSDPNIQIQLTVDTQSGQYTSALSIANTTISDTGSYYCLLNNQAGGQPLFSNSAALNIQGLIACWTLDQSDFVANEYLDSVGGHHATATGEPVFIAGADGQTNGAVQVDPQNGWATVPSIDSVFQTRQVTLSMWADWQDVSVPSQDLLVSRQDPEQNIKSEDGLRSDSQWQHICVVFDGTTASIYVDGSLHARGQWTLPPDADTASLLNIGSRTGGNNSFHGALDDIRIYNYALSGSEIAYLYQVTSGQAPKGVVREWWLNLNGSQISDLTSNARYPDAPDGWEYIGTFEGPANWGDSYGTKIYGLLRPPQTGSYTFWIAGDDSCELWLSTNDSPSNAGLIAQTTSPTGYRQWNAHTQQQSIPAALTAGQEYYIMALHKESTGDDHVSVAWQGPGITQQVIPGDYLTPYFPSGPYDGQPSTLPGKIQAEKFDYDGEGIAYHDTTAGNSGSAFRSGEDVDIASFSDDGTTAYAVDAADSEWLVFTVNSAATQTNLFARVASTLPGGQIKVWLDTTLLATLDVPNTGSLTTWQLVSIANIDLPALTDAKLKLEFTGAAFRVDWIQFTRQAPYSGSPAAIPGRIEFEDYDIGGQFISYYDKTTGNSYNTYRSDDVDIYPSSPIYSVFGTSGEWLEYTTDILGGTYDVTIRYAVSSGTATAALHLDGVSIGDITLPSTGGWSNYQLSVPMTVALAGGTSQVLRCTLGGSSCMLDYLELSRRYNPADIDHSTRVDLGDFAILAAQWQNIPSSPSADIALPADGIVNLDDLMVMAENWMITE